MDTKSQNSNMLLAFLTLVGVIAVVALVGFFMLHKGPEIVQGQADVNEYRVSSKVPGRILEFRVKEGQQVKAGDTLALLEAPDVQAKLEQAQNEKAIKGARQEQIQGAYEMWQKARAGVTIAEKSYKRVKNLYDQGVMSAQKLDEVTAQRDAAIATEKAAKSQYDMAKNGAEREDKAAAAASTCTRSCSRSTIVHRRDIPHRPDGRRSVGDLPQGGRTGRHRSAHHEHRRDGGHVGELQRTRGPAEGTDRGYRV